MRGTEQETKLAAEISRNMIHTMDSIADILSNAPWFDPKNPAHTGNIEACAERVSAIRECEDAGDLIDCFGGIRFTGDVYSDFGAIQSAYLSKVPATEGQHKLLMKN
jgi:hypothetical protein